jgi:outer membrane receptor protein involved in Fe transport
VNGGYFFQDQLGYQDYVFLTVGGRYDYASAFGENAGGVFYPKVSLSIVPSDRNSWTSPMAANTLRVQVPRPVGSPARRFAKFTTFAPLTRSWVRLRRQPSNPDLAPEVSTEYEFGAEIGFWDNRLGFDYTYWNRTVDDALIAKQFPLSWLHELQLRTSARWTPTARLQGQRLPGAAPELDARCLRQRGVHPPADHVDGRCAAARRGSYPRYRNFLRGRMTPTATERPTSSGRRATCSALPSRVRARRDRQA